MKRCPVDAAGLKYARMSVCSTECPLYLQRHQWCCVDALRAGDLGQDAVLAAAFASDWKGLAAADATSAMRTAGDAAGLCRHGRLQGLARKGSGRAGREAKRTS